MVYEQLPANYKKIKDIDLQKNKKQAAVVNIFALLIAVIMVLFGNVWQSMNGIFKDVFSLLFLLLFIIAVFVYLVLHELVHGVFMKQYSKQKVHYGFTGLYAYAGSDAYFNKKQYLIIALAPVILFGLLFLALDIFLPFSCHWFVYLLQVMNISGAAGDLYVSVLVLKSPKDILIHDTGVAMTFYLNR